MKSSKNMNQVKTSAIPEVLNLDLKTRGILQTVSNRLNKTPSKIVEEFVYSMDSLFSWNGFNEDNNTKEDLAPAFDFTIQHLHLLPQIAEGVSLLIGRDTDVIMGSLQILLERNTVRFDLGLGLYDLEKVFVTVADGHIQLFTNRHLSNKYSTDEIEKIKNYAYKIVKESVPYTDVTIGILDCSDVNKTSNVANKIYTDRLAADTIIKMNEVELTIRSNNVKYLPTFHKFNVLMNHVVYYFENHVKTEIKNNNI